MEDTKELQFKEVKKRKVPEKNVVPKFYSDKEQVLQECIISVTTCKHHNHQKGITYLVYDVIVKRGKKFHKYYCKDKGCPYIPFYNEQGIKR